jgi:hypothetical protein
MQTYTTESTNYWLGPYNIRVPNHICSITYSDGMNTLTKGGLLTTAHNSEPPTKEEYLAEYTELKEDGFYWYKDRNLQMNYWLGPYGMRVPNHINAVVAKDGYNFHKKNGCITEIISTMKSPTKEEYLTKYAELRSDGFYEDYWYKA